MTHRARVASVASVIAVLSVAGACRPVARDGSAGPEPRVSGRQEFQTDGLRLSFRLEGQGPVCVLPTPGWGASATLYERTLTPLQQWFTVAYLETRGSGGSQRPGPDPALYSAAKLTADLDALRLHLGQERIWLVGHSRGGMHVIQYAVDHPEHCAGLILIGTHADNGLEYRQEVEALVSARRAEPWFHRARSAARAIELATGPTDEELTRRLLVMRPFYFHDQEILARHGGDFEAITVSAEAYRMTALAGREWDLKPRLGEIRAPTLVITGAEDFVGSPRQARIIHAGIAGSRLTIVDEAGHFPWLERPDEFWSALEVGLNEAGLRRLPESE